MVLQSAFDRVIRTLIVSIGIGSSLFTILGLSQIVEQHAFLNPTFSFAAIAIFAGLPPVMAIVAFRAPIQLLRGLAGFHALSTLALLALWIPSMTDKAAMHGGGLTWINNMIAVASSEAAIALPFIATWIYMLVMTGEGAVVRYITYGAADPSQAIQDAVMAFLLSGFMMALIQLTVQAGKEQDRAAAAAQDIATANAAKATLERQRTRYHATTRDEVVTALYTAAQNTPEARQVARESAIVTLSKLNQTGAIHSVATIPISELNVQLRTAAVAQGISYAFSETGQEAPLEVPLEVSDALVDAMTEAMRNSNRHAERRDGRDVHRTARATRLPRGIEIVIRDDGKGFNSRRVGVDRLGMRLNIIERVNSLTGASAAITSVPGRGTTVTLDWNEPQ